MPTSRLVRQCWEQMRAAIVPEGASEDAASLLEAAFYGGCAAMVDCQQVAASRAAEAGVPVLAILNAIEAEVMGHIEARASAEGGTS